MSAEDGTAVVDTATPTAAPAAEPAAALVDATANAAAEGEGGEGNDGSQERDEHGRFKNPVQPRINELTRAAREAQRERDYWRAIATATTTQAPAPAAPKKPEASEFADYGDYVEALAEFKADEKVAKALSERDERSQRESTAAKVASTWEGRQADFRKSKPDYDDVMAGADGVSIKDHVGQALMDSDHGPAIAYQLAKNPALADKLNALSPTSAARAIGQMEASFAAQAAAPSPSSASAPAASAPAASPAVRTTSAPPPAKTTAAAPSAQVDLSKLSMDDYVKTRKQQGARWAR
jgi:hypothetical protein